MRTRLAVSSLVKALAEIFDFAAGLMQRVPKKTSIAKFDLQNSTANRAPSTHLALGGFGSDFLILLKFSKLATLRQWKIS